MTDRAWSLHLLTADVEGVAAALAELAAAEGLEPTTDAGTTPKPGCARFLLCGPRGRWVSVYMEQAWPLAGALCSALACPGLTVSRVEDSAFGYEAFAANGELQDRYHSCPDYALAPDDPEPDQAELAATRGDLDALAATLGDLADLEHLTEVLEEQRIERLREHDAYGRLPEARPGLEALAAACGLPDLYPDFDEMRHFAIPDDDLPAQLLAFRAPTRSEERWRTARGKLVDAAQRARAALARRRGAGKAPTEAASAEAGSAGDDAAPERPAP
ncbi:MAG: hypothetical protein KDD82_08425 [Planctomycetes bacterium]|nr:hypothetical protein [Planctomycetota bacterium]